MKNLFDRRFGGSHVAPDEGMGDETRGGLLGEGRGHVA